ncbi:unnamed protein product, partial [Staurois parvus]
MCIKKPRKDGKNLQKGIKLQIRHSYNMSTKVRFYFHHLHFQNNRNKKMASAKVWALCRVNILYCPLWQ